MRRELEDNLRKYTAWKRRTNRMYRSDDAGGRPLPEASKNIMRQKPYYISTNTKKGDEASMCEITGRKGDEAIEQAGAQETGKTKSN